MGNRDKQNNLTTLARRLKPFILQQISQAPFGWVGQGARVYNSANVSIADDTSTVLTFDSESWDTNGLHSTSADTDRLTIQDAGIYVVQAGIRWEANTAGIRGLFFRVNGATNFGANRSLPMLGGFPAYIHLHVVYKFAAGDYITCDVYQNSGGNLNVEYFNDIAPVLACYRVG